MSSEIPTLRDEESASPYCHGFHELLFVEPMLTLNLGTMRDVVAVGVIIDLSTMLKYYDHDGNYSVSAMRDEEQDPPTGPGAREESVFNISDVSERVLKTQSAIRITIVSYKRSRQMVINDVLRRLMRSRSWIGTFETATAREVSGSPNRFVVVLQFNRRFRGSF